MFIHWNFYVLWNIFILDFYMISIWTLNWLDKHILNLDYNKLDEFFGNLMIFFVQKWFLIGENLKSFGVLSATARIFCFEAKNVKLTLTLSFNKN
jgi:hypothetical protein